MWNDSGHLSLAFPLFFALPAWYWLRKRSKNALPYPPGPKPYPIIGNLLDFPVDLPLWEGLTDMAKKHETDVLRLKFPGMEMVVLNTSETVSDLLDQRSAIYSDKPRPPMLELMGAPESFVTFMPYGPRWRTHRKLFNDFISVSTVKDYDAHLIKVVSKLLVNLHRKPDDFAEHLDLLTGSLALSIAYGIQTESPDNEYLRLFREMIHSFAEASVPGTFVVDILPSLKYLPSWFPGVQFHAFASKVNKEFHMAKTRPVEYVAERLKAPSGGKIDASMVSTCLENLEALNKKGVDMETIYNTAFIVYIAMSDTTISALNSFFLAMTRNTEILRTAQRQLDSVLGGERLPDHSDMDDLPYIAAIVKETIRWAPPFPIGTTHRLMEDDEYRGMFIPGGATVIENIWAICYDENVYPDPHTYDPTRFLDKDGKIDPSVKDPEARVFGSGRRACPGRHFALRMLHFTIACILATFDILPPVDDVGHPKIPEARYQKGMVRNAVPFKCVVKPRSEKAIKLMHDAATIHQS